MLLFQVAQIGIRNRNTGNSVILNNTIINKWGGEKMVKAGYKFGNRAVVLNLQTQLYKRHLENYLNMMPHTVNDMKAHQ